MSTLLFQTSENEQRTGSGTQRAYSEKVCADGNNLNLHRTISIGTKLMPVDRLAGKN